MSAADEVIRAIHEVQFTPTRIRDGYSMKEVDDFLDQLENAVRAGESLAQFVTGRTFTVVTWREGYDVGEVDAFLARISGQLLPEAPVARPDLPQVIQEQRGLFARLFGRS